MSRVRIDKLLVDLGLISSRERARAMIMAGNVLVDETPVTKAGAQVSEDADVRIRGKDNPFVSRGGLKLEGALEDLKIDVADKIVLDVGASTGGFTDVCLQRGARRIFAVDAGTNQLAYSLRTDSRVAVFENTNARYMQPEMLPCLADMAVIDVSFISILKLLANVVACLGPRGFILAMVKPQFEVGRDKVGKGGVVRDPEHREKAVGDVLIGAEDLGLEVLGRCDSKVAGPKGNLEIFVHLAKNI